jgi:short subunit dehydrogenase-like uncharacterized protein
MTRDYEFDIVVWGATGFTGRLTAEKLAARVGSGSDLRWALGGRNKAKLEAVRASLGSGAQDVPIIVGDSHDVASLEGLVARTSVVCSTVGPYAVHGSELLGACARSGTHYCDISAEPHWIRTMMEAHAAEAAQTGARIVHACGMDSIPSDVGVLFLQRWAQELHGEPCSNVRMRVTGMKGGFSGGTAASLLHATDAGRRDPSIGRAMREPYYLAPEGHRQGPDLADDMRSVEVEYDEDLRAWTKPFFMGPVNSKIVRRTNALLDYPYGEDFHYREAALVADGRAGWLKAKGEAIGYVGFLSAVGTSPTRWLLQRYVLPASGEGPSRDVRESGHWEMAFIGETPGCKTARARVTGDGDPATDSTSRMLVESALCLVEDADVIPVGGGSWTPASAMGDLLLSRLPAHAGVRFEAEPHPDGEGRPTGG